MHRALHALPAIASRRTVALASLLFTLLALWPAAAGAAELHVVHGTLLDVAGPETARANEACLTATQLLTGSSAGEVVADGSACGTDRTAVGTLGAPCVAAHAREGEAISVVDERGRVVARAAIGPGTVQDVIAMTCRFQFTVRVPADSSRYTFSYYGIESRARSVTYTARQLRRGHWSVGLTV